MMKLLGSQKNLKFFNFNKNILYPIKKMFFKLLLPIPQKHML